MVVDFPFSGCDLSLLRRIQIRFNIFTTLMRYSLLSPLCLIARYKLHLIKTAELAFLLHFCKIKSEGVFLKDLRKRINHVFQRIGDNFQHVNLLGWDYFLQVFCSFLRKISLNPTFEIINDVVECSILAENIHHSL